MPRDVVQLLSATLPYNLVLTWDHISVMDLARDNSLSLTGGQDSPAKELPHYLSVALMLSIERILYLHVYCMYIVYVCELVPGYYCLRLVKWEIWTLKC